MVPVDVPSMQGLVMVSAMPPHTGPEPVTVVTGGSAGIGKAIAMRFAWAGQRVLLVARDARRLEVAAAEMRAAIFAHRGVASRVDVLALDVCGSGAAAAIERHLTEAGGYADILVNSAGTGLADDFSGQTPAEIEALLTLNVTALTLLMRHFLPGMRDRGQGGVLNIASLGGFVPGPYQAIYYASKAYVISLSEAVASEVSADGVRVTVVSPGPVATGFHARMGAERSLYRILLPALRPDTVASWAIWAFRMRLRSVVPGVVNSILFAGLRILPHRLVIPIVAWLLRPR